MTCGVSGFMAMSSKGSSFEFELLFSMDVYKTIGKPQVGHDIARTDTLFLQFGQLIVSGMISPNQVSMPLDCVPKIIPMIPDEIWVMSGESSVKQREAALSSIKLGCYREKCCGRRFVLTYMRVGEEQEVFRMSRKSGHSLCSVI